MATARTTMATARLSSGAFASGSRGSRGGKPRGGGTADHLEMAKNAKNTTRANAKSKRGASKSFIILPADGGFAATEAGGGGWTLWQESEAGSVLVGTRRARRRRQQMSDHWRKIMSLGGVEGAAPEDVSRRLDAALAALEREREAIAKVLHELERSNKGADVMAAEVKRLKVQKLRLKDDAARVRKATRFAAEARALGEGSFGRVFLGRDADGGGDVAVKVEDARAAEDASVEGFPSIDACQMAGVERLMNEAHPNEKRSFEEDPAGGDPRDGDVVTPLSLERAMLARVAKHAGPAGFPRVHHFGRQRVFGRESRVLVMDLLGPSLEEMSWAVSAGGPLSRLTTLMIADQALARLAAVHRAGVVHRDVKPDNLLLGHPARGVGANRALHLVDFGLAALGPSLHGVDDASVDERGSEGSSRRTSGDENSATAPTNLDEPRGATTNEETEKDVSKIKETPVVLGTPAFSAAAADAGRPPTYADDLEALVFTVAYLRAGTFPWCPPSLRGDVAAVAARKADAAAADLATRDADREWMGALLAHARATEFGAPFDLALCRGIVRRAFAKASGGKRMRDTPFDWEQAGVTAAPAERKAY